MCVYVFGIKRLSLGCPLMRKVKAQGSLSFMYRFYPQITQINVLTHQQAKMLIISFLHKG